MTASGWLRSGGAFQRLRPQYSAARDQPDAIKVRIKPRLRRNLPHDLASWRRALGIARGDDLLSGRRLDWDLVRTRRRCQPGRERISDTGRRETPDIARLHRRRRGRGAPLVFRAPQAAGRSAQPLSGFLPTSCPGCRGVFLTISLSCWVAPSPKTGGTWEAFDDVAAPSWPLKRRAISRLRVGRASPNQFDPQCHWRAARHAAFGSFAPNHCSGKTFQDTFLKTLWLELCW